MPRRKKGKMGMNALGDLEVDVMGIVWNLNTATVKDVFEVMYKRRGLAYTTIMTVMNRLAVKGILSQDKSSVPYIYRPLVARDEMATSMVREVVDRVLDGSAAAVMSYLIDDENIDAAEIDKLKALIKQKENK
ncbi:MAG: BlaI/MecI/CopY family transcriptional regulator [Actinomycetota bacterium]|nr:BlaI/MecI/CopY family transcriptional regulator [Actinomycetota bacterium]